MAILQEVPEEEVCKSEQVWLCSDPDVVRKRKRFSTCRRLIACCRDCPHISVCVFICSKLEELLEVVEEAPAPGPGEEKE